MDPPLSTPTATVTAVPTTHKLRLMCSYGGQIITRPLTKSLYYAGGDTRIITIPTSGTLTLPYLISHLSTTLHLTNPFTIKYQLPSHDLDSLISLSTDEDLVIMLDEHHRLSPTPSRIRLFIFQSKPKSELGQFNELKHPKTETWFADVLKSAKFMQKRFGLEGNCESGSNNNNEVNVGGLCGAESMVLEIGSSFGSTSSSVSLSNFPAKGVQVDDFGSGLVDNKVKPPSSESFTISDNGVGVATSACHPQAWTHQDPVAQIHAMENKPCYPVESEDKLLDLPGEVHKTVQVSGFPLSLQLDQAPVQYVHPAAPHYLPQNTSGLMPIPSYYVMSSPVPQQQVYYPANHPAPMYFVPVGHPYNMPTQGGFVNPTVIASSRPPVHPNPSPNPAQVAYKVAAASAVPETSSQVYRTPPMPSSLINVPRSESHHQAGGLPQVNQQAQSIGISSVETENELDDDPVCSQIYKSQPPPPTLPSQYTTMTKAAAVMLSEDLAQLHMDNTKQQIRSTQPQ